MNEELTIEDCKKAIKLYEEEFKLNEYYLKVIAYKKENIDNENFLININLKSLQFLQTLNCKLNINFDEQKIRHEEKILKNNKIIEIEYTDNFNKITIANENIKSKIRELQQISGFLIVKK